MPFIRGLCGSGLILMSAALCAAGKVSPDTNRLFILVGTIAWFIVTPMWLHKNSPEQSSN
jgi:hypothetical protein